jgi:1-phosphatidylinositol-3-phosphate 5-kinase
MYKYPLFIREHSKKILRASIWNDTLFLSKLDVMDYSLIVGVDEEKKELVIGIVGKWRSSRIHTFSF